MMVEVRFNLTRST